VSHRCKARQVFEGTQRRARGTRSPHRSTPYQGTVGKLQELQGHKHHPTDSLPSPLPGIGELLHCCTPVDNVLDKWRQRCRMDGGLWLPCSIGTRRNIQPRGRGLCRGSPPQSRSLDRWGCRSSLGCGGGSSGPGRSHSGRSRDGRQLRPHKVGQGRQQGKQVLAGHWCPEHLSRCQPWDSRPMKHLQGKL